MTHQFAIIEHDAISARMSRPASREDYFTRRQLTDLHGRLGYGGVRQRLVGCEVLELTTRGAHIEAYAPIEGSPKLFTLEVNGEYQRARLCMADGRRLRLEFVAEDLHCISAD